MAIATMSSKRGYAASAEVNGKLYITAGSNGNGNLLSSTEYITVEGEVLAGPKLPSPPRQSHCIIKLPSGKLLITGGSPPSVAKKVLEFDPAKNSYVDMPSLTTSRFNHACAVFKSPQHEGRYVVMTAGGYLEETAEILDYSQPNAKWTPSKIRFFFDFFLILIF